MQTDEYGFMRIDGDAADKHGMKRHTVDVVHVSSPVGVVWCP